MKRKNYIPSSFSTKPPFNTNLLTKSEKNVLQLISQDKSSQEVADILCVSKRTIDTHRSNIGDKLAIKGNNALLKFAIKHRHFIMHNMK